MVISEVFVHFDDLVDDLRRGVVMSCPSTFSHIQSGLGLHPSECERLF